MDRMRVAVLMGGVSAEREVSLNSGKAVCQALAEAGHDVVAVDVRSEDLSGLEGHRVDVAFPALHGRFGEDGGVQSLLEQAGIPYVGSDPQASRAAMDKMASKCFFVSNGVPTPEFRLATATMRWEQIEEAAHEIQLPLMVKPLCQGSSVGVSKATMLDDVASGLASAFRYGRRALLERYVRGREYTVGIQDGQALPIVELRPRQDFFDYFAKYHDDKTQFILDLDLSEDAAAELKRLALEAHRVLGCQGLSRVDLMADQNGDPYVLEVNTIPGMTERSLFPKAARARGISFPQLCERLCRCALETAHSRAAMA